MRDKILADFQANARFFLSDFLALAFSCDFVIPLPSSIWVIQFRYYDEGHIQNIFNYPFVGNFRKILILTWTWKYILNFSFIDCIFMSTLFFSVVAGVFFLGINKSYSPLPGRTPNYSGTLISIFFLASVSIFGN